MYNIHKIRTSYWQEGIPNPICIKREFHSTTIKSRISRLNCAWRTAKHTISHICPTLIKRYNTLTSRHTSFASSSFGRSTRSPHATQQKLRYVDRTRSTKQSVYLQSCRKPVLTRMPALIFLCEPRLAHPLVVEMIFENGRATSAVQGLRPQATPISQPQTQTDKTTRGK